MPMAPGLARPGRRPTWPLAVPVATAVVAVAGPVVGLPTRPAEPVIGEPFPSGQELNFAAFRELLEAAERGALERGGYRLLHLLDRFVKFESLYLFNRKPTRPPRGE
jgi:hypothetical protein